MLQRAIRVAGLIGVISLGLIAGQAGATVNGACSGSGTVTATGLQPATYTSSNFVASTLIKMPTAGSVQWSGTDSGWHGGRRAIGGEIYVDAPFGQHITEGSWGKTSTRTGNSGVKIYSFGSIADNVKATVAGYHDDAGHTTCSGSVNIQFDGSTFSNPLAAGSIAGIVVFGALLLLSGRAKA